jgi:MinD superfamily P-loop ATPase containing an inserted ferredoxin domain
MKKRFAVSVNGELCKACGYCAESCKKDVFIQVKEFNAQAYQPFCAEKPDNCIGCLACLSVCPEFAITIEEQE